MTDRVALWVIGLVSSLVVVTVGFLLLGRHPQIGVVRDLSALPPLIFQIGNVGSNRLRDVAERVPRTHAKVTVIVTDGVVGVAPGIPIYSVWVLNNAGFGIDAASLGIGWEHKRVPHGETWLGNSARN